MHGSYGYVSIFFLHRQFDHGTFGSIVSYIQSMTHQGILIITYPNTFWFSSALYLKLLDFSKGGQYGEWAPNCAAATQVVGNHTNHLTHISQAILCWGHACTQSDTTTEDLPGCWRSYWLFQKMEDLSPRPLCWRYTLPCSVTSNGRWLLECVLMQASGKLSYA